MRAAARARCCAAASCLPPCARSAWICGPPRSRKWPPSAAYAGRSSRCLSRTAVSIRSPAWKCWNIWTTRRQRSASWAAWRAGPSWCPSPTSPISASGNVLRGKHLGRLGNHPEHVQHWNLRTFPSFLAGSVTRGADRGSVSLDHRVLPSKPTLIFLLLAAIGVARIAATYRGIAQTSDETPNIACGMQYLDLGRYDYGAFHPPLARLAMAVGPYLYGARAQKRPDRWQEGNAVLNSAPRYGKALTLARLGILPFFLLACTVVWLWGRKLLGDWGALAPVFLFTNTPPVLAHAGLATMDMAIGAGIVTALFTYTLWLEHGSLRRAIFFGIGLALAVLSKFSAILLLPVCLAAITLLYPRARQKRNWAWIAGRVPARLGRLPFLLRPHDGARRARRGRTGRHFRARFQPLCCTRSKPCPCPRRSCSTACGRYTITWMPGTRRTCWAVTASTAGGISFRSRWLSKRRSPSCCWPSAAYLRCAARSGATCGCRPCCAASILLINLPTSLNIGVRYMLPLYPLLALTAGIGVVWLWPRAARGGHPAAGVDGHLHGRRASRLSRLLQRTRRLASRAHPGGFRPGLGPGHERAWRRNCSAGTCRTCTWPASTRVTIRASDYPPGTAWNPINRSPAGWRSARPCCRTYGWMAAQQRGRPDLAFAWLDQYQPVGRVGKSILLYQIPAQR